MPALIKVLYDGDACPMTTKYFGPYPKWFDASKALKENGWKDEGCGSWLLVIIEANFQNLNQGLSPEYCRAEIVEIPDDTCSPSELPSKV
jgi:hypothetical protein